MTEVDEHNDESRYLWDINESKGFKTVEIVEKNKDKEDVYLYSVRDNPQANETAKKLHLINMFILELIENCKKDKTSCDALYLLLNTPYKLQEIGDQDTFEGINKPKDVYTKKDKYLAIYDEPYRAGHRHIMLSLRDTKGKIRTWSLVKKLLIHELTHTACNHLKYYDERNHCPKFDKLEAVLKKNAPNRKLW